MKATAVWFAAALLLAGCDGGKDGSGAPAPTATTTATSAAKTAPTGTAVVTAAATATATAAPSADATAAPTATAPDKDWGCGAKGQKPCPMQGWMKSTMASATAADDAKKMAAAFEYLVTHAPPGYPEWVTMSKTGATKAKAGDLDGAKAACKDCHDAYKEKYKSTMRDRPF